MTEEERYVVDTFKKAFERDSSKRICLYGTGRFTELLLNEVKEYNILGVTDFNERKNVGGGINYFRENLLRIRLIFSS